MDERNEELNKRRQEREQERAFYAAQMKWLKIGLIATAAVILLCGAAILTAFILSRMPSKKPQAQVPGDSVSTPTDPTEETEPPVPDTVIHFVAGGDLNVTEKVVASGLTTGGYDYGNVLLDVMPLFAGANLSAVNFEGNVYGTNYEEGKYAAPEQLMQALRNAGVDLVQIANSRTIANGLWGLDSTIKAIQAGGMTPLGVAPDQETYERTGGYTIREVNGIRIAVVAFTKGLNNAIWPEEGKQKVNLLFKDYYTDYQKLDTEGIERILKSIQAQKPDVTIAMLHWGGEYVDKVSTTQEKICKLMQKGGVDAIIGTHPHYVQRVDYDGAKGTVVAYSLGDLLGNGGKDLNYSIALDLEITKSAKTGKVKITGVEYIPLYLHDQTETGGGMRVLQLRKAIAAYEENALNKVPDDVYTAMKEALAKVENKVKG